jgi:glycosyltransferase involved in cell wall biosynthesis
VRPHLGDTIEYVGEVGHADKVELLMDARALIFPIDWEEPFGLVVIEAMACGTPVIATRRGAVPEIIDHGRTGVIVDRYRDMEDPAALELADSLDPGELRREVEERFSPENMVANYVAAYEATIAATS